MIAYFRRKEYKETDDRITPFPDIFPVLYREIEFRRDGAYARDVNLSTVDLMYFRAVGSAYDTVNRLLSIASDHNIPVVDWYLNETGATPRTKQGMHNTLSEHILQPEFTTSYGIDSIDGAAHNMGLSYPYVAKVSKGGRKGLGTFLIRGIDDIESIRTELERRNRDEEGHTYNLGRCDWITQEYIPNDGDYRAMIIGGQCIGVTKRGPKKERLVMNSSRRGSRRFKNGRWPRDIGRVAVEASNIMKVDIAGVDVVRHSLTGQLYVIEVNEAPRFKSFEKATKINVGERIVEYLRGKINDREQA